MLDYKKTATDGRSVEYEYAIEGDRGKVGHVSIDTETGTARMTDHEGSLEFARYASKLMAELEERNTSGSLKDSGTVMWY